MRDLPRTTLSRRSNADWQGTELMTSFPGWGNVPEYFSGLALLVAVASFGRARRDALRSQADKVAAWGAQADDGKPQIVLRNSSDLPVTALAIAYNAGFRPVTGVRLTKNPQPDWRRKPIYHPVLPPGTINLNLPEGMPGPVLVTNLEFTDSHSVTWIRTETGLRPARRGNLAFWLRKRRRRIRRLVRTRLASIRARPRIAAADHDEAGL
jgi:hypothetical protein